MGLIDRYIAQVRMDFPERINSGFYEAMKGEVFARFVETFCLPVQFRLVYTPSRRTERISLGGETWLIYDQYLGQTLNLLNRIFVEAEGERPAIVYFHKYAAERALEYGKPLAGVYLANRYAEGRDILKSRGGDDLRRISYTILQERFAIFHELGHELLESDHDFASVLMGVVSETLGDIRERRVSETLEDLIERYRTGDPAAYHDAPLEEAIAEMREEFTSEEGIQRRTDYLAALDDPATAIELFCDFLAADISLMPRPDTPAELAEALRAIYVGSYHLKTLSFVDWRLEAQLFHGGDFRDPQRLQAMQVRNHCLRDHLVLMYRHALEAAGEANIDNRARAFGVELMRDQKRYYEVLFDPVSKLLGFLGEEGRLDGFASDALERMAPHEGRANARDVALYRDAIATLTILGQTGWPLPSADRFKHALAETETRI